MHRPYPGSVTSLSRLPRPSASRLAVRVTPDALRQIRAGHPWVFERSIESKREELERRRQHYEEVREQLARERERILNRVIPKRFAMEGEAQVFPVCVEIRFPKGGR